MSDAHLIDELFEVCMEVAGMRDMILERSDRIRRNKRRHDTKKHSDTHKTDEQG